MHFFGEKNSKFECKTVETGEFWTNHVGVSETRDKPNSISKLL